MQKLFCSKFSQTFIEHVPKFCVDHEKFVNELVEKTSIHFKSALSNAVERNLVPNTADILTTIAMYNHGALIAMHRSGVGKYTFQIDKATKSSLLPYGRFVLYTHRRLYDEFHSTYKGAFRPYYEQFGVPYEDRRTDPEGNVRLRFLPQYNDVFNCYNSVALKGP